MYFIDPDGMQAVAADVSKKLVEESLDVNVDIGYGRTVTTDQFSGSFSYSGAKVSVNKFKIDNNARKWLEAGGYKHDENISNEEFKGTYAQKMVDDVTPLNILYKDAGNPNVKYANNIEGANAEYDLASRTVWVSSKSFTTNLGLFYDLIHEGMHAWDHHNGYLKAWGWDGKNYKRYPEEMTAATEVRAYQIERWFGNEKRNEKQYQKFLKIANEKFKDKYQIKSFPVFFNNIQRN